MKIKISSKTRAQIKDLFKFSADCHKVTKLIRKNWPHKELTKHLSGISDRAIRIVRENKRQRRNVSKHVSKIARALNKIRAIEKFERVFNLHKLLVVLDKTTAKVEQKHESVWRPWGETPPGCDMARASSQGRKNWLQPSALRMMTAIVGGNAEVLWWTN
jgi:hypothetical protein